MSKLKLIQPTAQNVSEAISAALGVETEIVDDILTVIAGTGKYHKRIDQKVEFGLTEGDFLYARVLRSGKAVAVDDPPADPTYDPSSLQGTTDEMADLCSPIIMDKKPIGVISLSAFTPQQKEKLLANKKEMFLFLKRMGELLIAKISETEIMDELYTTSNEVVTILETIHEGILAVNREGQITHCNLPAAKLLSIQREKIIGTDLTKLWPGTPAMEVLKTGKGYTEKEEVYHKGKKALHFIVTTKAIPGKHQPAGLVISFRDISEARRLVFNMSQFQFQYTFDDIISNSVLMKQLKGNARQIAQGNSTVLITGESGTGKEMFARAIHNASSRMKGPFITVNCGAIPESLLESELFGYEGGAFTGARKEGKAGKFELADGGTIFLDEIGDMPLHLQVKLLHVLQTRRIERIGGSRSFSVDVRVIAATNQNLEAMMKNKEFREDLYFRLSVIPLRIPSLKERKEDIPLLMEHFLAKYNGIMNKNIQDVEEKVIAAFQDFDWPGNVRELENAVEYAVNMSSDAYISLEQIPQRIARTTQGSQAVEFFSLKNQMQIYEKKLLENHLQELDQSPQSKERLAKKLGISRATLYRKLAEHGLPSK